MVGKPEVKWTDGSSVLPWIRCSLKRSPSGMVLSVQEILVLEPPGITRPTSNGYSRRYPKLSGLFSPASLLVPFRDRDLSD